MAIHTPGPWRFYLNANEDQWTVDSAVAPNYLLVVSCGPPVNRYSEANARLIAAAPELLEACQNALGAYDALDTINASAHLPGFHHCLDFLKAAIAKAIDNA